MKDLIQTLLVISYGLTVVGVGLAVTWDWNIGFNYLFPIGLAFFIPSMTIFSFRFVRQSFPFIYGKRTVPEN